MLRKAMTLLADEIVLDLEDAVAPEVKDTARRLVVEALAQGAFDNRLVAVRVNPIGSRWHADDVAALAALANPPASIVLPKIGRPEELKRVTSPPSIGLQVLIETAAGLVNSAAIAAADTRLVALVIGYGDLASSLGCDPDGDWSFVQQTVLVAARASDLQAIDGPCFDLAPQSDRLARDCARVASSGFDGKWAIHPAQVELINRAFSADPHKVARAQAILDALDRAASGGEGIAVHDGMMLDEAMRLGALRTLANAGEAV